MEIVEIKRIGAWSTGRLFGGIFLVIGLIIGTFYGWAGTFDFLPFMENLSLSVEFGGSVGLRLLIGLLFGIGYGLLGGLSYALFSLIYNLFALIFGGIKIKIEGR
jgi:hypothetical protein